MRKDDEGRKLKRGDTREDGKVFVCYNPQSLNGEWRVTPERLVEIKKKERESILARKKKNELLGSKKRKRGDRNGELVFSKYQGDGSEVWVTPEKLEELRRASYEWQKEYQKKNKEKIRERERRVRPIRLRQARAYRERNRDRVNAYFRARGKTHPEEKNACTARRRPRILASLHPDHDSGIDCILARIVRMVKPVERLQVDHIVPLSRGGMHHHSNLRLLPFWLNQLKRARLDEELEPQIREQCEFWTAITKLLLHSHNTRHPKK